MRHFASGALVLLYFGIAFGTFDESLPLDLQDLVPGSPISLRSLDGFSFSTQSAELVFCTRVRIPGRSRIWSPHKFAHTLKLQIQQDETVYYPQVAACLHRNASLGVCECSKDNWKALQQGRWTASRSPFETMYLDLKTVDPYTDSSFKVTATEEFRYYHLFSLFCGFALLLFSGVLSSWVPFYYTSAMTLGILLVVLILLYQGMKLLPTGKKSTLSILLYGSLLGFGTVLMQYVASLLSSALSQLGVSEDVFNPVAVFFPVLVAILGAWLGYWGVRKLVLVEDGRVDIGTAQFVKWALRLAGATMLLQSSRDDVFAVLIMALGGLACWASERVNWTSIHFWNPSNAVSSYFTSSRSPRRKVKNAFYYKAWSQTYNVRSPQAASPGSTYSSSPKTPGSKLSVSKDQDFISSFHKTPGRKPLSSEEYEEVSRTCTGDAMKGLFSSPDFAKWAICQADRIMVAPTEAREERAEDEIQKTAFLESEDPKPSASSLGKRRFPRYI